MSGGEEKKERGKEGGGGWKKGSKRKHSKTFILVETLFLEKQPSSTSQWQRPRIHTHMDTIIDKKYHPNPFPPPRQNPQMRKKIKGGRGAEVHFGAGNFEKKNNKILAGTYCMMRKRGNGPFFLLKEKKRGFFD